MVIPFGLTNAPFTFQSPMNKIFKPYLWKSVLVFFYDILIYSNIWPSHISHLGIVFQILEENQLYAKKSKCDFGHQEVEYVGHAISKEGVKTYPQMIQDITTWFIS
jgi:hypothetical protein